MSIEAKYFFQIKTDANRYRTVSNPPCTVNRTEACVPRYTVKRYIVSPLVLGIYLHFLWKIRFFNLMSRTYQGLWDFYLSRFVLSIYSYTFFQSQFWIICCDICKTSSYSCIEVNDKHRDCPRTPPSVTAQNTEYLGLYRNSQLRWDVTPTSRIRSGPKPIKLI